MNAARLRLGLTIAALSLIALLGRARSAARRMLGRPPRVVWGTTPIISIKYWSEALRRQGIPSRTIVDHFYPSICEAGDFDQVGWWNGERTHADDYRMLARVMLDADVVSRYFDGGFLRLTPLARLELPLLRLAGCRIVAAGYGSDIAVPGHQGPWEEGYHLDYPTFVDRGAEVRQEVDRVSRAASVVVRTLQPGYQPRWDILWGNSLAVDTDLWRPEIPDSGADGSDGPVTVVHAANHRALKGTQSVIDAVETLRAEGLQVELALLERKQNREVRAALRTAHIAADQFVLGYQLFAVEAMSAGLPVLSRIGWWPKELRSDPGLGQSPVVDADADSLPDRLRELVTDPERRRLLGRRSREHALRFHSYDAMGKAWANVINHAWRGERLGSPLFARKLRSVSPPVGSNRVPSGAASG